MRRPHANNLPGAECYAGPSHGPVIAIDGRPYCPHADHNGRPAAHPLGPAPSSTPWQDAGKAAGTTEATR